MSTDQRNAEESHIWGIIAETVRNDSYLRGIFRNSGAELALELLRTVGADAIDRYIDKRIADSEYTDRDRARIDEALKNIGLREDLVSGGEGGKTSFGDILSSNGKHAAEERFDDVEAALDALGVDKPSDPHIEHVHAAVPSDPHSEHVHAAVPSEPAGDLWEIAIRDTYNSVVEVRADKVQFGIVGLDSQDIGFTAYLDGAEVFHAPAGMYHYAKKVAK